ncbi:MAG: hypothetical protein AAF447_01970 [Myxococcota bacterium]
MLKRSLLVLALTSLTLPAAAQRGRRPPPVEHDFVDGDQIDGTLRRTREELITSPSRGARQTLIRVRTSFVPELTKSVERR